MISNKSTKNIWDDSQWTVEDDAVSPLSINSPRETLEFLNTMKQNKGHLTASDRMNFSRRVDNLDVNHIKESCSPITLPKSIVLNKNMEIMKLRKNKSKQHSFNLKNTLHSNKIIESNLLIESLKELDDPAMHKNSKSYNPELRKISPKEILSKLIN